MLIVSCMPLSSERHCFCFFRLFCLKMNLWWRSCASRLLDPDFPASGGALLSLQRALPPVAVRTASFLWHKIARREFS